MPFKVTHNHWFPRSRDTNHYTTRHINSMSYSVLPVFSLAIDFYDKDNQVSDKLNMSALILSWHKPFMWWVGYLWCTCYNWSVIIRQINFFIGQTIITYLMLYFLLGFHYKLCGNVYLKQLIFVTHCRSLHQYPILLGCTRSLPNFLKGDLTYFLWWINNKLVI